jgi:hypothetical protein
METTARIAQTEAAPAGAVVGRQARILISLAVGILAVLWLMFLSGWFQVHSGSLMMKRNNVLFDSDMNYWVARMIGNVHSPEQTIHPLELIFWRYPCRALAHIAGLFMATDEAGVFGSRLFVALVAGSGFGALAYLALSFGVPLVQCLLLFGSYFLFTANIPVALPEHFGISNGLISIAFVVLALVANEKIRNSILILLAVLCSGTSLPNGLLPAWCFVESVVKSTAMKMRLLIAGIPLGIAAFALLYRVSGTVHRFFGAFGHFRLLRHPLQALIYSFYLLAAPTIGAIPFTKNPGIFVTVLGWRMVTYDPYPHPIDFSHYFGVQGIAALIWLFFLGRCTLAAFRDEETRPYARVAALWVLFSLVFYNVWGREPFLFSTAWAPMLMALIILGARKMSRWFIVAMVLPMAVSQIVTLYQVKNLMMTIDH